MENKNIKVCVIDYGSGNVRSVVNMVESMGISVTIANTAEDMESATHLILPGVGAFGAAMAQLQSLNLIPALTKSVIERKKPFLGICVGMQILADKGMEHGNHDGLGWIPGEVCLMDVGDLRLPHVGWNNLKIVNRSELVNGLNDEVDFYFTHSYSFCENNPEHVCAEFEYGGMHTAAIYKENIFGVQFHPEKSQKAGKVLLNNFFNYQYHPPTSGTNNQYSDIKEQQTPVDVRTIME